MSRRVGVMTRSANAGRYCAICAASSPAHWSWSGGQSGWGLACRPLSSCSSRKGWPISYATSISPSSASPRRERSVWARPPAMPLRPPPFPKFVVWPPPPPRPYNRGRRCGCFHGGAGVSERAFSVAAAALVAVLIYWLSRASSLFLAVAIGLIIGGAVGNVIDRLRLGAVVDFLDFHLGAVHWPAFNLADSAICIGVAAMLLDGLLLRREAH